MQPRHSRLTRIPVPPRVVYSTKVRLVDLGAMQGRFVAAIRAIRGAREHRMEPGQFVLTLSVRLVRAVGGIERSFARAVRGGTSGARSRSAKRAAALSCRGYAELGARPVRCSISRAAATTVGA
jgi:hypothetical protein